jgi:hypothetical protein
MSYKDEIITFPLFNTCWGKDLYKMFKWINGNDTVFIKDLTTFKKENPNLTSLKQWIEFNFKPIK